MRDLSIVLRTNILASLLRCPLEALRFGKTKHGKPYLINNPDINFSVSHTGTLWGMAVAPNDVQVGLDIEQAKPRKYMNEIITSYFHPDECKHYQGLLCERSRKDYFYKLWTQKEAYAKYLGLGLQYNFSNDCFITEHPRGIRILSGLITGEHSNENDIYVSLASSKNIEPDSLQNMGDDALNVYFIDR